MAIDRESSDLFEEYDEAGSGSVATATAVPTLPLDQPGFVEVTTIPGVPQRLWRLPVGVRYYLTLETTLYLLIIGFAIFTRFYNLAAQALHHDEGVHAYYSWRFYNGQGYDQEPWKHGPFLYHVTALVFWLFGDGNETVRLSTAFFGVLTCLLPIGLRKELGRWGALSATFLLTVSPMFLYFSRFLREDIFVAFATFALFVCLVRFVDRPAARWWYGAMASLAMLLCTKEVSFFYILLFGGFLAAWLGWQLAPRLLAVVGGYGLIALIVFFFVMGLYPPPPIPFEHLTGSEISTYIGQLIVHPIFITFWVLVLIGVGVVWLSLAEVAGSRRRFMIDRGWAEPSIRPAEALFAPYQEVGTVAYAIGWLGRHWRTLGIGLGLAFAFYFIFFTGFLSNIPQGSVGLISGLWYWMAQQGVARGSQPWYYYFFMLPLYEPLALLLGTLASTLILVRSFQYGLRRSHRTLMLPIADDSHAADSADNDLAETEEDELDNPEAVSRNEKIASNNRKSQASIGVQIASTSRGVNRKSSAGNSLWPGRRRRERHPYFVPLLLVAWAWGSLALYTWASEKMPWLTVQLALPFILLAAWLMDKVWSGLEEYFLSGEHRQILIWKVRGNTFFWIHVGGLFATAFLAYMVMLNLSATELKIQVGGERFDWLLIWIPPVIALLFFTGVFSFIGLKITLKATLAVVFAMLTIYLLHTGFTYAFDHGDVALEMGVYTQTTPDLYRVAKELDTVTTMLPEGKNTPILYDTEVRTPLDFYLRHYDVDPNAPYAKDKKTLDDFKTLSTNPSTPGSLTDYSVIMISDPKVATLTDDQKKILSDNYISRHYTYQYWFEESQYRDFDKAPSVEISELQGKPSKAAVKDTNNAIVVNKDQVMTTELLQQLSVQPGVLDRLYNANGGNATILHLQQASQSLYHLRTPGDFARLWRYVMFREQFQPLGRREFTLYIKKNIAPLWRKYADLVDYPISGDGK